MKYWLLFFLVLFVGCENKPPTPQSQTYNNVARVFLHEAGLISFFVKNKNTQELQHVFISTNSCFGDDIKFFADVPKDKSMWVKKYFYSGGDFAFRIDVHIHDSSDVDGGSWDHGKHGSGKTNVVE